MYRQIEANRKGIEWQSRMAAEERKPILHVLGRHGGMLEGLVSLLVIPWLDVPLSSATGVPQGWLGNVNNVGLQEKDVE